MITAPHVTRPRDLPDWRLWLVEQWRPGHPFAQAYEDGHVNLVEELVGSRRSIGAQMARWEHRAAERSSLWWVNDDMTDLVDAAAPSVPDSYVLNMEDAPDMAGAVVFEHTIHGIDANDRDHLVRVDALIWAPVALPAAPGRGRPDPVQGVGISIYTRVDLGDMDGPQLQLLASRNVLTEADASDLIHLTMDSDRASTLGAEFLPLPDGVVSPFPDDAFIGDGLTMPTEHGAEHGQLSMASPVAEKVIYDTSTKASVENHADDVVWVPCGRSDWVLGETITTPIVDGLDPVVIDSMIEDRRWLAALWLIASQTNVTTKTIERPDRAAARRSQRAKVDPSVTVVKLRRISEPKDPDDVTHSGREWHHRWIVSGHWRNQPYGPGRGLRRPMWIAPYVKGPEGMPLVDRPKVKALVR